MLNLWIVKRFNDEKTRIIFYQSPNNKLDKNTTYNAILSADDDALNFVLKHDDELFNDIPKVFFGVNNIQKALSLNSIPDITGVVEAVSMKETIELMIQLFPDSKTIYCITYGTSSGDADLMLYRHISTHMPAVSFKEINLAQLTFAEYKSRLSSLPSNIPVLLLSAYHDKLNEIINFQQTITMLDENLEAPLFHLWGHGMGEWVSGRAGLRTSSRKI